MIRFDWDENKSKENIKKHNIGFIEASTVFYDENSLLIFDPDHSEDEDRFLILGLSSDLHLLIVCHCYRYDLYDDEIIRIISARKATKNEAKQYEEGNYNEG